jgi:hypothetical protein
MANPVTGYHPPPYAPYDDDTSTQAREFCLHAETVVEGFLCDEPTAVSDACRTPKNSTDEFVCDDKNLATLQKGVWDTAKDILKTIFGALVGSRK